MSSVVVFLGPSLSVEDARAILPGALYLPPVRMGDVFTAAQKRPAAIAIIDGFFENTAAVWHKEILHALAQGIPVFGASSMGALRGAELHAFGMIGVGKVFEAYASGAIEDDDEVAVVHAPGADGCTMFSEAMVNIRAALERAQADGLVSAGSRATLLAAAKETFYPERSWAALFDAGRARGVPDGELAALRAWVEAARPNQKRDDALELLALLAREIPAPDPALLGHWTFEHTVFWDTVETYYTTSKGALEADSASFERVRNHVRLVGPEREQLRLRALTLVLAQAEAQRLRIGVTDDRRALARFRYRRGLQSSAELRAWMERQQVGQQECLELARLEMLMLKVEQRYVEGVDQNLGRALKLAGFYPEVMARVNRKWEVLAELGIEQPTEDDVGSFDEALQWYQERFGAMGGQLDEHAADLGYGTKRQFLNELFAEYLAAQRLDAQVAP